MTPAGRDGRPGLGAPWRRPSSWVTTQIKRSGRMITDFQTPTAIGAVASFQTKARGNYRCLKRERPRPGGSAATGDEADSISSPTSQPAGSSWQTTGATKCCRSPIQRADQHPLHDKPEAILQEQRRDPAGARVGSALMACVPGSSHLLLGMLFAPIPSRIVAALPA